MRRWFSLAVLVTLPSVTSLALADEPLPPPAQPAPSTMPPPSTTPTPPGPPPGPPGNPHGGPHGGWAPGHGGGHGRMGPPFTGGEGGGSATPSGDAHSQRVTTTVDSGSEKNAVLERRVATEESSAHFALLPIHATTQTWEQVCVAPCRVELDRASMYRVAAANEVTRSGEFTLPPAADQLQLQVRPGNLHWYRVGTKLSALGTAAGVVGGALIVTASTWEDPTEEKRVRTAGIITAAAGLVLLGIGIPLAILNRTHVQAGEKKLAEGVHIGPGGLAF